MVWQFIFLTMIELPWHCDNWFFSLSYTHFLLFTHSPQVTHTFTLSLTHTHATYTHMRARTHTHNHSLLCFDFTTSPPPLLPQKGQLSVHRYLPRRDFITMQKNGLTVRTRINKMIRFHHQHAITGSGTSAQKGTSAIDTAATLEMDAQLGR